MTGHFIAFEGGEGSGKSTQARRSPSASAAGAAHLRAGRHAPRRRGATRWCSTRPTSTSPTARRGAADGGRPGPARRRGHPARAASGAHRHHRPLLRVVDRLPGPRPPARRRARSQQLSRLGHRRAVARPGRAARGAAVGAPSAPAGAGQGPAGVRRRRLPRPGPRRLPRCRPWPTPTAGRSSTAPSAEDEVAEAIWEIVAIRFPDLVLSSSCTASARSAERPRRARRVGATSSGRTTPSPSSTAAAAHPVHSYLLVGPAGSGKRAAARAFAALLLSAGSAGRGGRAPRAPGPGRDAPRPAHRRGHHRPGPHRRAHRASEVVQQAALSPAEGSRKVLVLEDFHLIDQFGAILLKYVEEPPGVDLLRDPRRGRPAGARHHRLPLGAHRPRPGARWSPSSSGSPPRASTAAQAAADRRGRGRRPRPGPAARHRRALRGARRGAAGHARSPQRHRRPGRRAGRRGQGAHRRRPGRHRRPPRAGGRRARGAHRALRAAGERQEGHRGPPQARGPPPPHRRAPPRPRDLRRRATATPSSTPATPTRWSPASTASSRPRWSSRSSPTRPSCSSRCSPSSPFSRRSGTAARARPCSRRAHSCPPSLTRPARVAQLVEQRTRNA